jgi:hypothetical protein
MNITVRKIQHAHGNTLKLGLCRSYRFLGKPRARQVVGLGSIRSSHLTDAATVENFLQIVVQKLFAEGLSPAAIRILLRSLARRVPHFDSFFQNLKF